LSFSCLASSIVICLLAFCTRLKPQYQYMVAIVNSLSKDPLIALNCNEILQS